MNCVNNFNWRKRKKKEKFYFTNNNTKKKNYYSKMSDFVTPPPSLRGYRFPDPPRRIHKNIKVLDLKPINLNKEVFSKIQQQQQDVSVTTNDGDEDAWLHVSLETLLSKSS